MTEHSHDSISVEEMINADVDSPGTSSTPLEIHPEAAQGGARISKKSKKIIFAAIAGLGIALIGGIFLSGKNNNQAGTSGGQGGTTASESDNVGKNEAPKPPQKFENQTSAAALNTSAGNAASGTPAATTLSQSQAQAQAQANQGLQQQHELSPSEKYKAWLIDQKYKKLEGSQLSADSAQEAGFGEQGSLSQRATASTSAAGNTDAIAAIRAAEAAGGSGIDPALLAKLGIAAGGDSGAASSQAQNKSFLAENKRGDDGYLHAAVDAAIGKHELLAGSIIPAVLLTALDSDLPGFVTAMVRQTVYDSLNHQAVLIPQGAKLVGRYSSDVAYGQSRALIAWNRLIFPNGSMIDLQGMAGTDGQGQAGFEDQTDNHYTKIFGSSILMSLLGAAAQLSQPQSGLQTMQPTPQQQAAGAMASGMANTGNQVLSKNLSVQPTIKIRAGYLFNVMVNKSMIMPVWAGEK
ncbi:MAG: hypothetical protein AUJ57_00805 [Zetaproteobacteria bacterium CG1_02_53_45]|nr:MAG: hypothetical protein AUJ57_00805 [Zetaproteobacteria bacterium CG1_02_53_45]